MLPLVDSLLLVLTALDLPEAPEPATFGALQTAFAALNRVPGLSTDDRTILVRETTTRLLNHAESQELECQELVNLLGTLAYCTALMAFCLLPLSSTSEQGWATLLRDASFKLEVESLRQVMQLIRVCSGCVKQSIPGKHQHLTFRARFAGHSSGRNWVGGSFAPSLATAPPIRSSWRLSSRPSFHHLNPQRTLIGQPTTRLAHLALTQQQPSLPHSLAGLKLAIAGRRATKRGRYLSKQRTATHGSPRQRLRSQLCSAARGWD